ncbi:hypothetical protein EVAR_75905_1 [Eumeta japonica]|uniref:Uncharacterized protein n=1 Tax=Eumeta variegata TaxID=151549 RepID=A0A4C1UY29_EUMVA|nr:hypothetical protein EVAR_75905_1 [Eumeta japonica]
MRSKRGRACGHDKTGGHGKQSRRQISHWSADARTASHGSLTDCGEVTDAAPRCGEGAASASGSGAPTRAEGLCLPIIIYLYVTCATTDKPAFDVENQRPKISE